MEDAGLLLMGVGEVRDVHVFCSLVEECSDVPSQFSQQTKTWKPAEVELGWAKVLTASLKRNLQLISDQSSLLWWLNLPAGEWAYVSSSLAADLIPDFKWLALRPCEKWKFDSPVRFQEKDFPELSKQMSEWMQQSIYEEFRTYNSRMFELFLAPRLALFARNFSNCQQ